MLDWDLPGGLVAKILSSHCKGSGFGPWSVNEIPYATARSSHATVKH